MNTSYYCKISDMEKLHFFPSENVRWLDPVADYDLIREYFRCFGIMSETDTYFGIGLGDIKKDFAGGKTGRGRLLAYISDGVIVSLAAVEYALSDTWEIRAVSSRPDMQNHGYAKCVCAFAAKYILSCGKQAILETNRSNYAMQHVTKQIGMVEYHP